MPLSTGTVATPADYSKMPTEYQELVMHQLRQHVEGELTGAYDYLEIFFPLAPDAFEKKVCCQRASEELDHFMLGAAVLADIGFDASYMLGQSIADRKYYKTEGVAVVDTWLKRGLFSFIGEAVVLSILEEMATSSYVRIAEMTRQVIIDEHVHVAHGRRIVESLIGEHGAATIQPELDIAWAMSLDLFGKSDSARSEKYVEWGLRKYTNREARSRFIDKMAPQLEAMGLQIPENGKLRKFL